MAYQWRRLLTGAASVLLVFSALLVPNIHLILRLSPAPP
jgi:hypothetical protein